MIDAWIVIVDDRHVDIATYVFTQRDTALGMAREISAKYRLRYRFDAEDIDQAIYGRDFIFQESLEDSYGIVVKPQVIYEGDEFPE